jgi:hypothetical protein
MEEIVGDAREFRAARNESLFRTVNENVRSVNETFATITDLFTVMCECADVGCTQSIAIPRHEYVAARANDRHFVVVPSHVDPDVERVVSERDGFVMVEKTGEAGLIAEELAS